MNNMRLLGLLALIACMAVMTGCVTKSSQPSSKPVTYGPDVRTVTVTGKIDPRLYAWVLTTYRPTDYDSRDRNSSCTRSDWNTATRKGVLDYELSFLNIDKQGRYKAVVPIDYVRKNRCGYEFVNTVIRIHRDKRERAFTEVTLLDRRQTADDYFYTMIFKGGRGGPQSKSLKTDKRHYRLAKGSEIMCFTKFNENTKNVRFYCVPEGGGVNGVDSLESDLFNLDITVNERKCEYIFGDVTDVNSKLGSRGDYFRDYKE